MITASVDGENDGKWWQMPEDGTGSQESSPICVVGEVLGNEVWSETQA